MIYNVVLVPALQKSESWCSVTQSCLTLCDPMDCSWPGFLPMGFYRREYWSGLPFPSPGDLPDPGTETQVSYISCISRQILYHCASWEARVQKGERSTENYVLTYVHILCIYIYARKESYQTHITYQKHITDTGGVIFCQLSQRMKFNHYKGVKNTILNYYLKPLPNSSGYHLK